MLYKFGEKSTERLNTAHPYLQLIMNELIQIMDVTILEGTRGEEKQNNYYHAKKSKVQYPNSKHNKTPSLAVDVAPYPVDWNDLKRFYYMAGLIIGISNRLGIKVTWGGCWRNDNNFSANKFFDGAHFQLDLNE